MSDTLVYSTETGRICSTCSKPISSCICKSAPKVHSGDGIAKLGYSVKGRNGKPVTTITGIAGTDDDLADLARALKQKCGTGGTVKDGIIEIQGDKRAMVEAELVKRGLKVKRIGG